MSFQVTTAMVDQYKANVAITAQQKGSKLLGSVMVDHVTGRRAAFDQITATAAVKRTARHADTPLISTPHDRRWAILEDYDWADLIDDLDKAKILAELTSPYVQNAGFAMGRALDDLIIEAFDATAVTGQTGTGTQAFDSGNLIAQDFVTYSDIGSADVGLHEGKLIQAKRLLLEGSVDPDEPLYCLVNGAQLAYMLSRVKPTSADYSSVKALVRGDIDTFMGFTFIITERLPVDAASDDLVFCWAKSGVQVAMAKEPRVSVSVRHDKNDSVQVYYSMSAAAVRMEEAKVICIECDPT